MTPLTIHRYKLRYIMFPWLDDETGELIHWDVHYCKCAPKDFGTNNCACTDNEPDTTFIDELNEARAWVNEDIKHRRMVKALGLGFGLGR